MARVERLSLDQFGNRRRFGSLGRKEDRPGQAKHAFADLGGWLDALRRQGHISSTPDPAEPCPDTAVSSAEEVFEKGWVAEKGHFGLEVDIEADNEYEADAIIRNQMATMGFDIDDRSGFPLGAVQLFRDGEGEDDTKQEHMRYYGVVEDEENPGHFRAIFVMEGDQLPQQNDEQESVAPKPPGPVDGDSSPSWGLEEDEDENEDNDKVDEEDDEWELEPDDEEEEDSENEPDDESNEQEDENANEESEEEDDEESSDNVDDDDASSDERWEDWDDWGDWDDWDDWTDWSDSE